MTRLGHRVSDETRAKLSAARRGRVTSDETRAKQRASAVARQKRSESTDLEPVLAWPPTTAADLESFWVQRDSRYVLRHREITEQERVAIFAARKADVDRLGGPEQAAAWRMLSRWVLPHI